MVDDLEVPLLLAPRSLDRTTWWADKAVWGSVGNLAMTAVGTVVLTLPAAAKETGWLIALGLVVLFAVLSDVSMIFLVHCGVLCGKDDYEHLGKCILGARGATAIRISLLVLLVGSLTSVNIIVADLVPPGPTYF
jgi:amino acid permease